MQVRIAAVAAAMVVCSIGCTAGAGPLTLQRILPNPSPNNGDNFGQGVSLSGGKALVGAPFDATTGSSSGQAYIIDAASGTVLRTLANPGTAPTTNDFFGQSVSLSGNNALIGVQNDDTGASNSGVAHLFNATTGALVRTFTNPTTASGDGFGHAVAVSGNLALISATGDANGSPVRAGSGAAYLFDMTTGTRLQTFLNPVPGPASGDNFGFDVALFGNRALISTISDDTAALNAGAAYLFDTTSGALLHTFLNPTPELNNVFGNNDNFGFAVALSSTRLAIGAPNEGVNGFQNGAIYLYDLTTFALLNTLLIPTPFIGDTAEFLGNDVALSDNCVLGSAPFRNKGPATSQKDLGAAFLYDAKTGAFLQEVNDTAPVSNDRFGFAVALDGCDALIGAQTDLVGTIRPGQAFYYAGPVAAPEPGTLALLMTGLAGLALVRRRSATSPP